MDQNPTSKDRPETTPDDLKTQLVKKQAHDQLLKELKNTIELDKLPEFPWAPRQAFLALSWDFQKPSKEQGIHISKETGTVVIYWVGRIVALRNTPNSVILGKVFNLEGQAKDIAHSFNTNAHIKSAIAEPDLRKKAIDESPWPFDHERCSVLKLSAALDVYRATAAGHRVKVKQRGGYRFKSHRVSLNLELLGSILPDTKEKIPTIMRMSRPDDFETLRETALLRNKPLLTFYAAWRRTGWHFTIPIELTEDDPSELLSQLEARKRLSPAMVSFSKELCTYYSRQAFEWFANNSPLNYIFYMALLEFMAVAYEYRSLIIPEATKYTPVPPEERKTKARWTKEELDLLTRIFAPDENGTRTSVTSDWDWENVFKHLQPHHRSKLEVQRKIASMNIQIKKSLQIRGMWTEEAKKEFARRRLGQLTRSIK